MKINEFIFGSTPKCKIKVNLAFKWLTHVNYNNLDLIVIYLFLRVSIGSTVLHLYRSSRFYLEKGRFFIFHLTSREQTKDLTATEEVYGQ